jgi:RNA polymerase sigma-70 factor (ECF subfamily)
MPSDGASPGSDPIQEWLAAARRGNNDALGRLLEACRPYLLQVAHDQLGADLRAKVGASDLVQDTFLEARRDFGGFHGLSEAEMLAWLRRILLNNLGNLTRHYRQTGKRQVRREVDMADVPLEELVEPLTDHGGSPSAQARARERDEALERALAQLSEAQREVIRLRNYERLSFEDVGRRMGRSAEAARKLWGRAIEQLQRLLEPSDEP